MVTALLLSTCIIWAQENMILSYIRDQSDLREGGSGYYVYNEDSYVISVATVVVGKKNEIDCKRIGETKAKREMITFINGSEITSYTELSISETVQESLNVQKVVASQSYKEVIKEKVLGSVNEVKTLGGWFSKDSSVYYFAIYKILE